MQLSGYRLVLYPVQASTADVRPVLQALALLGASLAEGIFATGEQFLDHVCFLGCSPDIELEAQTDKPFCYIRLPTTGETVTFQPIRKPPLCLQQWVVVGNIHEAEAIPDAALLTALETASACRWKFAYLQP
jgi:hypothetical protein